MNCVRAFFAKCPKMPFAKGTCSVKEIFTFLADIGISEFTPIFLKIYDQRFALIYTFFSSTTVSKKPYLDIM